MNIIKISAAIFACLLVNLTTNAKAQPTITYNTFTPHSELIVVLDSGVSNIVTIDVSIFKIDMMINGQTYSQAMNLFSTDIFLHVLDGNSASDIVINGSNTKVSILIDGQGGNDSLVNNTPMTSVIIGGAGHDLIAGGSGIDFLYGGSDDDTLSGGQGNDTVEGGQGDDVLAGDNGDDTIRGGMHDDIIDGGHGDDLLFGGSGNDELDGGQGNDTLEGNAGMDLLDGRSGNDVLSGGIGKDELFGGSGDDKLFGTLSYATGTPAYFQRDQASDSMWGEEGADEFYHLYFTYNLLTNVKKTLESDPVFDFQRGVDTKVEMYKPNFVYPGNSRR